MPPRPQERLANTPPRHPQKQFAGEAKQNIQGASEGSYYLGEVAKREGQGEAGGVDGPAGPIRGGTGADEVVPVRVGEEAVAPVAGGGAPRVDGEGEPPRHVYRHPPLPKLPKNYG